MDIVFLIAYISLCSPLLTLGFSFLFKNNHRVVILMQVLLGVGFIVDLICLLLGKRGVNTYPIGNLFLLFQAIMIFFIYNDALKKKYVFILASVYGVVFFLDYFFIEKPFILNSYSHSLSSVIFILLSLLYFRKLLIELPVEFVSGIPMVWINLGILVYYSGNLFIFLFNNYFTDGLEGNQRIVWSIHNMLNIAKNILFMISIWSKLRKIN